MAATSLDTPDVVLLAVAMLISALIGLYFTNKNSSMDAYMLGDRQLPVIPVAISLMTSCMSTLTLLGSSAELYYQGASYATIAVAILLCGPLTAYTILPVFYRMEELSLHKYLERRFGLTIKYIVSTVFVIQMTMYNSVVLYMPSIALSSMLDVSKSYSILTIGLMCVLYSSIGGIKAVVWTDLFQAAMMYLCVLLVGYLGTQDAGGLASLLELARAGGRLSLDADYFSLDPTVRHTLAGVLVGSTIKHVYLVGVNQVQIQRACAMRSLAHGQRAFVWCSVFTAAIALLSSYLGLVVYGAYRYCDPFLANQIERRDALVMHYVAQRLARVPGARGIFVAGMFCATLSTLSSFANSMAAIAIEDFVRPAVRLARGPQRPLSSRTTTRLAKALATAFGLVTVLAAYGIDRASSRLLQATTMLFGAIGVPFLAAFALGLFTRFANSIGVMAGFATTLTLGAYLTFYQTFLAPALQPSRQVAMAPQCLAVFNGTLAPDALPPLATLLPAGLLHHWPPVKPPFRLEQLSYMSLPAIQFGLTLLVASLASLLSGGWAQEVDEDCLVDLLRRPGAPRAAPAPPQIRTLDADGAPDGSSLASDDHDHDGHYGANLGAVAFDSIAKRKRKQPVVSQPDEQLAQH